MPTPHIPQPLRAAAGLAAVAIDNARKLPQQVVGFPVLAVSTALQASLKAQQRYAELVVRGDQLLGQLRGQQDGTPPWARFDDDVPGAPARSRSAFDLADDLPDDLPDDELAAADDVLAAEDVLGAGEDGVAEMADAHPVADLLAEGQEDPHALAEAEAVADALAEAEEKVEVDPPGFAASPVAETLDPEEEAAEVLGTAELVEAVEAVEAAEALDAGEVADAAAAGEAVDAGAVAADDGSDGEAVAGALAADGYLAADAPLPGYDTFTLPQLRGRLRSLSAEQLEALAAYERATRARAPFLTMLDNRLTTVRAR